MIIDVHSHIGAITNSAMSADGERLAGLLRQAGITHAVTFSIEACYGSVDLGNRYTLDEVASQPMLSAMVVAHPLHLEASATWIREAASNPRIVGVKLHPVLGDYDILDRRVRRLMEEHIGPAGLTVLSHVGNESPNVPIDKYLKLASYYPQIRFIAAHLGIGILGSSQAAVNAWAANPCQNVWFDMGTLRAFASGSIEALLEVAGSDLLRHRCAAVPSGAFRPRARDACRPRGDAREDRMAERASRDTSSRIQNRYS